MQESTSNDRVRGDVAWSTKSVRDFVKAANSSIPINGHWWTSRENDLAPNTWRQNLNITKRLGHVETDPLSSPA
ncbi:hypothetical protein GQ600_26023 [Phytophthora cactorum]|nr:hypothetical protein GQ600_26023 [Phytophthora cactorum]